MNTQYSQPMLYLNFIANLFIPNVFIVRFKPFHLCKGGININNGQLLQSKQRYKWGGRCTLIISKQWYCILTKSKFQHLTQVSQVQEQTIDCIMFLLLKWEVLGQTDMIGIPDSYY